MSTLQIPTPGNLTISIMYRNKELLHEIRAVLEKRFGEIDYESPQYDFSSISPYYDPEMGSGIYKIIYSFKKLISREKVKDAKLFTVELEEKYSENGNRLLNLDPGLLTLENFLLTTGKNYSHRIYLGEGVFAEITLMFRKKGEIKELEWTYRDYLYEPARSFLLTLREHYRLKQKAWRKNNK